MPVPTQVPSTWPLSFTLVATAFHAKNATGEYASGSSRTALGIAAGGRCTAAVLATAGAFTGPGDGQARDVLGRDARTVIANTHLGATFRQLTDIDIDVLSVLAIFTRVFDEVLEDLNEFVPVSHDLDPAFGQMEANVDIQIRSKRRQGVADMTKDRSKGKKIIDQPAHAVRLVEHDAEKAFMRLGIGSGRSQKGLDKTAQRGKRRLPETVAKRAASKGKLRAFTVEPEVIVNNQWSERYTVIEVSGLDRPGLLYELTTAISKLNLNIASAHVATFGERARDVFYVTDLLGAQINAPTRQAAIKRALIHLL
eukprot:gene38506-52020_t